MSDAVGCEVCHKLTKDGYTLQRYGNGFRCQTHMPHVVVASPAPSILSCDGRHVDNPRACGRVRCQLGNRCVEPAPVKA